MTKHIARDEKGSERYHDPVSHRGGSVFLIVKPANRWGFVCSSRGTGPGCEGRAEHSARPRYPLQAVIVVLGAVAQIRPDHMPKAGSIA